jgi:hypothetical protein
MDSTATMVRGHQYMRALERANEVRLARAELKRRVADGDLPAAEVILTSPWEAESMAVADLLMSQRRWGRTRSRRFLATIPISENKTIGSMTDRQRLRLAAQLASVQPPADQAQPRRPRPARPAAPERVDAPPVEPTPERELELTGACT